MIALNMQPKEKQVTDPKMSLEVIKVFPTIQGEGPLAGTPAVFVRLAGCNLDCPFCDTQYTEGRKSFSNIDLAREVFDTMNSGLVVITGGEPFRQPIGDFVRLLFDTGNYDVQIETNGTLYQENFPWFGPVNIVCSPKTPKVDEQLLPLIDAYKYVLSCDATSKEDGLPTNVLGNSCGVFRPPLSFPRRRIFVQPMDAGVGDAQEVISAANLAGAIRSCMKYGYRLSLQTHKLLGLE